jgi:Spy/CpxP family protein refolding chaperone
MKKNVFLLVAVVAFLLISSSAFAQTCEKMIKMGGGMGEGMHKMCSQMGDVTVEKTVKCCGMRPGMMGCCGKGMMGDKMGCCKKEFFLCCKEKLELTDQQVASLKSIKFDFMKGNIQKEADLKVAELELKELMSADKLDMTKVEKAIKNIHMMKAEKKIAHLKAFERAKSILTPEQLEKQKEHHKMMMKGM